MTAAKERVITALMIAIVAALAAFLTHTLDGGLERTTVTWRYGLTDSHGHFNRIAAVAIDTRTGTALNQRIPLPRDEQARVVRRLVRAGARLIAYDLVLDGVTDPDSDIAIVGALASAPHAVVAVDRYTEAGVPELLAGIIRFARTSIRPGAVTRVPAESGPWITFPHGVGRLESFPLAVRAELRAEPKPGIPAGSLIDYLGPAGTLRPLSFVDVLDGHFSPAAVRGRIVIVGDTAPEVQDQHDVPVGGRMTGMEIEANAIATALDGFPLRRVGATGSLILGCLLAALESALILVAFAIQSRRRRPPPGAMAAIALGVALVLAWSMVSVVAFQGGAVVDYTSGLVALAASCTLVVWRASLERRRHLASGDNPDLIREALASRFGRSGLGLLRRLIPGFTLETLIAVGGMGVVYKATETDLDRKVALKLIKSRFARDRGYRSRFLQEARNAAAITHPNVLPVYRVGRNRDQLFIVMPLVAGETLAQRLEERGFFELQHAVELIHRVALALDRLSSQEIVHCDVKPSNILIAGDDPEHPYLTDFGIARALTRVPGARAWPGTPAYMSPEVIGGREFGPAADVYSLAACFFHLATGTTPFLAEDRDEMRLLHVIAPRPSASSRNPTLPAAIDPIIQRAMAIDPNARFPTACAFTDALLTALATREDPAPVAGPRADGPSQADTTELA